MKLISIIILSLFATSMFAGPLCSKRYKCKYTTPALEDKLIDTVGVPQSLFAVNTIMAVIDSNQIDNPDYYNYMKDWRDYYESIANK